MCGITGFVGYNFRHGVSELSAMVSALNHRGPDSQGKQIWDSTFARIAFGHTRLSIIDLSEGGAQPKSKNHWHITFNGEIYNYNEIKKELQSLGHKFASDSDTEVILSSLEQWGIGCLSRFIGMFAFAAYNSAQDEFYLVRDRAGIKPLYYQNNVDSIIFGSELKALLKYPDIKKELSTYAIKEYFKYGYIPSPNTIYTKCKKLDAGHYIKIDLKTKAHKTVHYWNPFDFLSKEELKFSDEEYLNETESLFRSAFKYRMVADVPVGVFLSGGYDSSLVTALLQSETSKKLKTFTIGFESKEFDESTHAEKVASHLGTDHTTIMCKIDQAKGIITSLPEIYDEPFGDPSAIPTCLVSVYAAKSIKVALSADGGDEQFIGYKRYPKAIKLAHFLSMLPRYLKPIVAQIFKQKTLTSSEKRVKQKIYQILLEKDISNIPQIQIMSLFEKEAINLLLDKRNDHHASRSNKASNNLNSIFASEYTGYMQDDILTKVDRASMAAGLEARDPLLDHRIAEWTLRTPVNQKYKNKILKSPIKDIVHKYVPKSIVDRKKQGFRPPVFQWLKGDLLDNLDSLLNKERIISQDLFDWGFISDRLKTFKEHNHNDVNRFIWHMFVFQQWYNRWV